MSIITNSYPTIEFEFDYKGDYYIIIVCYITGNIINYNDPNGVFTEEIKEKIQLEGLKNLEKYRKLEEENAKLEEENKKLKEEKEIWRQKIKEYDQQRYKEKQKNTNKVKKIQKKIKRNERLDEKDINYIFFSISAYYNKIIYEIIPNRQEVGDIDEEDRFGLLTNYERLYTILHKYYENKHIRKDYKDNFFKEFARNYGAPNRVAERFDSFP